MTKQGYEKEAPSFRNGNGNGNVDVDVDDNHADTSTNSRGRSGTSRSHKSKSPMRQNRQQQNNKSRSPTRIHHNNKSRSPTRSGVVKVKKPAAMTVIVNRCDLWDSAAHFQPDECIQPQTQHSVVHALPYRFANGDPTSQFSVDEVTPPPPPGIEKQEEAQSMSVTTARVPHQVESMQFPIKTHDECAEGTHQCDVIDTTIPNPHDPNVVHNKYWAQRR